MKNILSIAGSDPSGGAGIQADLKSFSALGCYGMAVITALTAQNTQGVSGVLEVPSRFVISQINSILSDIRVDAIKIGMAGSPATIRAVARLLKKHQTGPLVIDPVMAAQNGGKSLLSTAAADAMTKHLFPQATIITPNIPEAAALLHRPLTEATEEAAQALLTLGPRAVLLKGGHGKGKDCTDIYADRHQIIRFTSKRLKTRNNHGTGCTLSSAIASFLAQGHEPPEACHRAKTYITQALYHARHLKIGHGHGPVHHFWK